MSKTSEGCIQVSGNTCFETGEWRKAILYYLFGVWEDRQNVMYRPKISFKRVTLFLGVNSGTYLACGETTTVEPAVPTNTSSVLRVGCSQMEVEYALVKFVKNNNLRMLIIHLDEGELRFTKGHARSDLTIWASGIPTFMDLVRRNG